MATLNFDASQIDPRQSEGGICLPLADYPCEISKIEQIAVKDTPNKGFLAVHLKVLDGQYVNQVQIDRLNIYGQAETPTRIGYQRLSAYAHIAGKLRVGDSQELIGTKLIATCGPQDPPNEKYSDVKLVKDIAGNLPVHGQPCAPQPAAGVAFGGAAPAPAQGGFPPAAGFPPAPAQQQQQWPNPAQQPAPAQGAPAGGGTPWGTAPAAATGGAPANTPPWAK